LYPHAGFCAVTGLQAISGQPLPFRAVLGQGAQHSGLPPARARHQRPQLQESSGHRAKHTSGSWTYSYINCHLRLTGREHAVFKKKKKNQQKRPQLTQRAPPLATQKTSCLGAWRLLLDRSAAWSDGQEIRDGTKLLTAMPDFFKACHVTLSNLK